MGAGLVLLRSGCVSLCVCHPSAVLGSWGQSPLVGARPGIEEFLDADNIAGDAVSVPVCGADNDVEVRVLCEDVVGCLDGFSLACVSIAIGISAYFHLPGDGGGGFEFCKD